MVRKIEPQNYEEYAKCVHFFPRNALHEYIEGMRLVLFAKKCVEICEDPQNASALQYFCIKFYM